MEGPLEASLASRQVREQAGRRKGTGIYEGQELEQKGGLVDRMPGGKKS